MVRIKICGITREKDLDLAVSAGADAVGFVMGFPESPRNLSIEKVSELTKLVPPFVSAVLVSTQSYIDKNIKTVSRLNMDAIQLYDCCDPQKIKDAFNVDILRPYLVGGEKISPREAMAGYDALLCDSYRNGMYGGTGIVQNFDVCAKVRDSVYPKPMVLAGGLGPDNVQKALECVRPFGVDASSRLESSPGVKDPSLVMQFVKKVREFDGLR